MQLLYNINYFITRVVITYKASYNKRMFNKPCKDYIMCNYVISNSSNRLTINDRVYTTNSKFPTLLENDVLVYSLLLSEEQASPSQNRANVRYSHSDTINLPVISNISGADVNVADSIHDFFEYVINCNPTTNYIIPIDMFVEYGSDYYVEDVARQFLHLMKVYNITNIILPIEWSDYEDFKKLYEYSHYDNEHNRFHRGLYVYTSIKELVRKTSTSDCRDIKVTVLGQAFNEMKEGWVII